MRMPMTSTMLSLQKQSVWKLLIWTLVAILVLIELYPLTWLLLSSFKAPAEFSLNPIYALPEGFYWQNYIRAWTEGRMGVYFQNSLMVTVPSLFLILCLGSMAAFGIEILKWRFNNVVLIIFLLGIMIPVQMILLPLFAIYNQLQLLNTFTGLILVYTAFGLPLTIFLLVSFAKSLPHEVLEAALIDGANIYQIFSLHCPANDGQCDYNCRISAILLYLE
ncbi:MAG: hypothetical protein KatS3mg056_2936 [Chloroflexus sp.]|nr:MAG: hypothetical protein KatS3mg056_2936 [Chloroflexus sp.]